MPKLWDESIEAHRAAVRDAVLDTTWRLVTEHGPLAVTMSQIAEKAGVGRATLYKYFPDVESILAAWHERHTAEHLQHLSRLANRDGDPRKRLRAVLNAYALIMHERGDHDPGLEALLHRGERYGRAQRSLIDLVAGLLAEAQQQVRADVPPAELAGYCVNALAAARNLQSKAAVGRLVDVVLDGVRPEP